MKLAGWGLFSLPLLLPLAANSGEDPLRLPPAEFILRDSAEPPPDSAAWQQQTLAGGWNVSRPGVSGDAWYRLLLICPPTERVFGIYTHMKQRAKVIGGELDIQPSPSGTTLSVLLPVG
jgi:hypothetical protein